MKAYSNRPNGALVSVFLLLWDRLTENFNSLFQLFTLLPKFANFIPKFDLNLPTAVWVCR